MAPIMDFVERHKSDFKHKPVILSICSITLTKRDLNTVDWPNWLNDSIIIAYLRMACPQNVFVMDPLFQKKIQGAGIEVAYKSLKKDIFDDHTDIIFIVNPGEAHWALVHVDMTKKIIEYHDSLHYDGTLHLKRVESFLNHRNEQLGRDIETFTLLDKKNSPFQSNPNDCGVFTILNSLLIMKKTRISTDAYDEKTARQMRYIIRHDLLVGKNTNI